VEVVLDQDYWEEGFACVCVVDQLETQVGCIELEMVKDDRDQEFNGYSLLWLLTHDQVV
jgi:hypothetical protein